MPVSHPAPPVRSRTRAVAATLALALALGAVGLDAHPAAAVAPDPPRPITPVATTDGVRFMWAPPADTGSQPVSSYEVVRTVNGVVEQSWVVKVPAAPFLTDTSAKTGVVLSYKVRALNPEPSSWVVAPPVTRYVNHPPWWPFASEGAMIKRHFQDFLGRAPTQTELNSWTTQLHFGHVNATEFIQALARDDSRKGPREAVIRFYLGLFGRAPDSGGLHYWTDALTKKTRTLESVASFFQASNEYKTTYGTTTDAQFVGLLYVNVYRRPADSGGLKYWVGELTSKNKNRAQVMINFTQLEEGRILLKGRTEAADIWEAMLGGSIDSYGSAKERLSAHIDAGGQQGGIGAFIQTWIPSYQP